MPGDELSDIAESGPKGLLGAQTLVRGLEVVAAIAGGAKFLNDVSKHVGLNRSTAHRLANTLVECGYLNFTPSEGYSLGPQLLRLGFQAARQMNLPRVAHKHLLQFATETGDTVHLGIRDKYEVLYIDKIAGSRRVEISSRIGDRQSLRSTGLGKALLLDEDEAGLREIFEYESNVSPEYTVTSYAWLKWMKEYSAGGYALDLEENGDRIRCVAAPIRDVTGRIVASISVSSVSQYMSDERMESLIGLVKSKAVAISAEVGWLPETALAV